MGDRGLRNDSREVRWGILGAGHISHRFASSLKKVDGARLVAAAGRTPAHVEEFPERFRSMLRMAMPRSTTTAMRLMTR